MRSPASARYPRADRRHRAHGTGSSSAPRSKMTPPASGCPQACKASSAKKRCADAALHVDCPRPADAPIATSRRDLRWPGPAAQQSCGVTMSTPCRRQGRGRRRRHRGSSRRPSVPVVPWRQLGAGRRAGDLVGASTWSTRALERAQSGRRRRPAASCLRVRSSSPTGERSTDRESKRTSVRSQSQPRTRPSPRRDGSTASVEEDLRQLARIIGTPSCPSWSSSPGLIHGCLDGGFISDSDGCAPGHRAAGRRRRSDDDYPDHGDLAAGARFRRHARHRRLHRRGRSASKPSGGDRHRGGRRAGTISPSRPWRAGPLPRRRVGRSLA